MCQTTHSARGVSAEDLQELKLQRDTMIASAKDNALQQLEVVSATVLDLFGIA